MNLHSSLRHGASDGPGRGPFGDLHHNPNLESRCAGSFRRTA